MVIGRSNPRECLYENLDLRFFVHVPGSASRMILKNRNRPGSTFPMRIDALFAFLILIFWGFSGLGIAAPTPFAVSFDGNTVHIASGFSFPNKMGDLPWAILCCHFMV
jgi:hypothetical protein